MPLLHRSPATPFQRPRVLIVGCGDIGMRVLQQLTRFAAYRVFALTSQQSRFPEIRAMGAVPILGNLDHAESLWRLGGLAETVIHLAPPQQTGNTDLRTQNLLRSLSQGVSDVRRLVYVSTTGVYGDCGGGDAVETAIANPQSERAKRRWDAEWQLRQWALLHHVRLSILRVPGIYDANRLPVERIKAGTPALLPELDAYSNHIQADDLARIVCAAMYHGKPQRIVNACDGAQIKMGDYFDQVADAFGLERPPRLPADQVQQLVSPMLWSFMRESRRVGNDRLKELKVRLRYPNTQAFLSELTSTNPSGQPRD
jgi:nucleoside-diphosphate-sugar epimerase